MDEHVRRRPRENEEPRTSLDDFGWALVRELQSDARQTMDALSEKLNVSPTTISRRLTRLLDQRAIRLTVGVRAEAIGYSAMMLVGINTQAGSEANAVASEILSLPGVVTLVLTAGRFNMFCYVGIRDFNGADRFLNDDLARIRGVSNVEVMISGRRPVKITSTELFSVYDPKIVSELGGVVAIDRQLVEELIANPRVSIKELATRLGVQWSTANRRLRTLLDSGGLALSVEVSQAVLGRQIGGIALCRARPGKAMKVAEELAANPHSWGVVTAHGRWNCVASLSFRDINELAHFVTVDLAKMSGLQEHEMLVGLRLVRRFGA